MQPNYQLVSRRVSFQSRTSRFHNGPANGCFRRVSRFHNGPANGCFRRVLVIPESRAPGALRFSCSPNAVVGARGGVFIRGRPPTCAGDRAFRMGTEMGGARGCFRILLEYLVNSAWMDGSSSSGESANFPERRERTNRRERRAGGADEIVGRRFGLYRATAETELRGLSLIFGRVVLAALGCRSGNRKVAM